MKSIELSSGERADPETMKEFFAIGTMLSEAEKNGLLVEVVWSFASALQSDVSIELAASAALAEWDI